jgi:PPOX class probable F420-dependent enzyme
MGVRLTDEEAWDVLRGSHTGVLTTLRRDGAPAAVPMWFVVDDQSVWVRTLAASPKAKNIRRDPRVCFLVESGLAWAELRAVVINGRATVTSDEEKIAWVDNAFATKYADFLAPTTVPDATRRHYAATRVHVRIEPTARLLTWDNARIVPRERATS